MESEGDTNQLKPRRPHIFSGPSGVPQCVRVELSTCLHRAVLCRPGDVELPTVLRVPSTVGLAVPLLRKLCSGAKGS